MMYVSVLEKGAKGWDDFELVMGSGFRMTLGENKDALTEKEKRIIQALDKKVEELLKNTKDMRLKTILEAYIDAINQYPL